MTDLQTDEPNWEIDVVQAENDHLRRIIRLTNERLGESAAEHMMRLAEEIMDLRKKTEELASRLADVQREKAALLDEVIPLRVAVEAAKTRNERRRAKKEQKNDQG